MEVLVAVGCTALILALLFSGLDAFRRVLARRNRDAYEGVAFLADALRQWADEMESATDPGDGRPGFIFTRDPPPWTLHWVATRPIPELPDAVERISLEYRFEQGAVYRRVLPLDTRQEKTAPRAHTSPWVTGLVELEIDFFDGRTWHRHWPIDDGPAFPVAARIRLHPRKGPPLAIEVSIPAGEIWSPKE